MVNKKGVEIVHCVCLSCHFDMGLFHILGQEVPQLTLLMILLLLTMIFNLNLLCFLKLSNTWSRYLYSRGMRLSTCTLSSTLLIFAFTLNLIIQNAMIGEWELDTKYCHITIINLSRRFWRIDETYACFTSTHLYIFPKCPPFIFRFSSSLYDHYRMFLLIILHTCGPYYYLLC